MKLVYLSNSEIPSRFANSVHVMKMCSAFARNGSHVTLVGRRPQSSTQDTGCVFEYYGVEKLFDIELLSWPGGAVIGPMIYTTEVVRAVRSTKPELYYGRHLYSLFVLSSRRSPAIYEAHAPPFRRLDRELLRRMYRTGVMPRVVVISAALRRIYLEMCPWIDPDDILVAHDGADCISTPSRASLSRAGSRSVVGYVGSLYEGRGIDVIYGLSQRFEEVEFRVVGGSAREVEACRSRYPAPNLQFVGHLPHGELQTVFSELDVLLAPYQNEVGTPKQGTDTSGWMSPLKLFEYMAQGKPIIASSLPAIREVLTDESTALLCAPDDVTKWAAALSRLLNEPELAEHLSRNALSLLENRYTWTVRARSVLEGVA
jgi:glycosyltransferase involved in cell wall biosynthesis